MKRIVLKKKSVEPVQKTESNKNFIPPTEPKRKRSYEAPLPVPKKQKNGTNTVLQQITEWNQQWHKLHPINVHVKTRFQTVKHMCKIFSEYADFNSVLAMERLVYEITFPNAFLYRDKIMHILVNIENNPVLLQQHGKTPETFVFLDSNSMIHGTDMEQEMIEQKKKIQQYNAILSNQEIFGEDNVAKALMVCRKCKNTNIFWTPIQTRSADEPATIFCTCKCGNQWKTQ
jgi:DNA-directed RNA polymerase subunit M/transcription elongation factor TFIIS